MRIVEFENGKFAIRVFTIETIVFFKHQYIKNKDNALEYLLLWTLSSASPYFKGCLFDTLEEAREFIKKIKKPKRLKVKSTYKV